MTILEKLFAIIAPHLCLVCGREGRLVCAWCLPEALLSVPERCFRCGALSQDYKTCAKCRPKSSLGHVWVRTEYEGMAKELVHALKFTHAKQAATEIAQAIHAELPYFASGTVLVHIPTVSSHVRQRGFDQSALIARELGKRLSLRHHTLLARIGRKRQVGAERSVRLSQLQDAFRPLSADLIQDAHILLVDDVITTGGTLEAAAQILKNAGAKRVDAIVFAYAK